VQDDKSFDVPHSRSVASTEIDNVAGQCLAVNVKYLHSQPFGSHLYLGVIFGKRVHDGGNSPGITYATVQYLEVKVRPCTFMWCIILTELKGKGKARAQIAE
jgi:hypothetical protein